MPLTPKQTAILELLVRRQEVLMDIQALRREYERKSPRLVDNEQAQKILNAEYAAEMRTRETIRDSINSKLAGETPLGDAAALGLGDWLPPAKHPQPQHKSRHRPDPQDVPAPVDDVGTLDDVDDGADIDGGDIDGGDLDGGDAPQEGPDPPPVD